MDTQRRPSFLWPLPMQNSQVKCSVSAQLLLLCVFKYQPRLALCQQSYAIHINAHFALINDQSNMELRGRSILQ